MSASPLSHHGILLLDKPAGKSSFYLVWLLRKVLGEKKIGHTGTLDPFATGVMVMLIGKTFTRQSDRFLNQDKEYETTLLLGQSTDTYDLEGQITHTSPYIPSLQEVEAVIAKFQGSLMQEPPMFSAKKVKGQKLYELARKGIEIPRSSNEITIQTKLLAYNYPHLTLHFECSKGTYIRSLGHEIGLQLKTYAHCATLRRLRSGPFHIKDCLSATKIMEQMDQKDLLLQALQR